MLLKIFMATLTAATLTVTSGCGDPISSRTTSKLKITAVDGYITGATVTDQQGNTAVSNGDGTYSFVKAPTYPIGLIGGTLLDTGDAFSADILTGALDDAEAHMYAPSGLVISPITTLLTKITNNRATSTLDSTLSAKLAAMMGVTETELLTDFVASDNINLAKIAQVIHLMAQEPGLYSTFKTNLGAASGSLFSGVSGAATTAMNARHAANDLSTIKQTIYNQIITDVSAYTGTAAGLEAGIDDHKSMLENITTIEALGGVIGSDIESLQTARALIEIAGSGDSTKTITAAQLTRLGVSSAITNSANSVALMVDVIRQSTSFKYDTKAEVESLETHITHFVLIDTQAAVVSDANLLAAYKVILDDSTIKTYKQVSLAALTDATSAVTATSVAAIQTLLDGVADIAAPVLTVTVVPLNENAGTGQTIANASATFAAGSKLGVFSLTLTGDYATLSIDATTGEVTVNADPDYETKTSYVFTVKVTAVTNDSSALAISDSSEQTTGAITDVGDIGIASVAYSYGAEDGNAHAIGGTESQIDDTSDNALLITFNVLIDASTLASENFSIDGTALASGLSTNYHVASKLLTITIGDAAIDVDATSNSETTSTVSASSSVKTSASLDFDSLSISKIIAARTGIAHSGKSYNTVKSPDTGVYWFDRNLGATQVATSPKDTDAYGELYQWGRLADGHQFRVLPTGSTAARTSSITPTDNKFITNNLSPFDWTQNLEDDGNAVDGSGALRHAFLSKTDGSGICPVGFRVPTQVEMEADTTDTIVYGTTTAFDSFLALTEAGERGSNGILISINRGLYWTSTPDTSVAGFLDFYSSDASMQAEGGFRTRAFSVRCLKH